MKHETPKVYPAGVALTSSQCDLLQARHAINAHPDNAARWLLTDDVANSGAVIVTSRVPGDNFRASVKTARTLAALCKWKPGQTSNQRHPRPRKFRWGSINPTDTTRAKLLADNSDKG